MKKLNPISFTLPSAQYRATGLPLCLVWVFIMNQQSKKQYKTCPRCEKAKLISEFNKHKAHKDGLGSYCKSCAKEYNRKWCKANPKKVKESNRKQYKANSEKIKESIENWKEANIEKVKKNQKNWCKANFEKRKEYDKKWKEANPEKVKKINKKYKEANPEYDKKYKEANKDKIREYYNQYTQNRRATDSLFKLRCKMRGLIRDSLKRQGYTKDSKTYNILGIQFNLFYEWLNGKASNDLNYNTNDVDIDHCIPVNLADTKEEVLLLNHYSNLQLLSPEENLLKNNTHIFKTNLSRVLKYYPNPEMLKKIVNRSEIQIIN